MTTNTPGNPNTSSLTQEQDSLYLANIINNCVSISAELLNNSNNSNNSGNNGNNNGNNGNGNGTMPVDGTTVDPNYNNYMDMLVEFLCEPVGDAIPVIDTEVDTDVNTVPVE